MRAILKHVTVVSSTGTVLDEVDLRIAGDQIRAVSKEALPIEKGEQIIDGKGKVAFPGFMNAHTHLPMVLFRGLGDNLPLDRWLKECIWPREEMLDSEDVYWASLLGLSEMIRSGTTRFADMYFHVDEIGRAVEETGLRALLAYGIIASEMDEHGTTELKCAESIIERWKGTGGGRIQTAVSPHSIYTCGEAVWRVAIELAQKYGVAVHTHLAETEEEVTTCRAEKGKSPVFVLDEYGALTVPILAAHGVYVDDEDIDLLAERDVKVVHCPKSNAKLGNGVAPIAAMHRQGVTVLLGTDGAASNNNLNMIEEMRAALLFQRAICRNATTLSARDVFEMATWPGPAIWGSGGLEAGQPADIVLMNLDAVHTLPNYEQIPALVYAGNAQNITDVIVAGRYLLRNGELETIDEERVKEEIKRRSSRYKN
jgi:5-methylthioadenosine/S-adenosylhomocysteine deaminase